MKPADRTKLTTALREHVANIARDIRAKVRQPGAERERALRLHAEEHVGDDFEVWTDLLSRRAAVLWVLKSVYVRVLEDRGLLSPSRLLDPEAEQLFERLAPNLGPTAFLRWIYRDLASRRGGLPELFSPQPAEVALPADELSRDLISFWRHRDPDTGGQWSFSEERFEGELMGDLYQELDPIVKERFALCQTPDFVRGFILDQTLTPAIETFGANRVRMLDPSCGSGHFLIDGLKRLVVATGEMHPDWDGLRVVKHSLNRVVGIDLNDYACALARARLVMTAAELAAVVTLAQAGQFHPHVYWADGLEQVEKIDAHEQQLELYDESGEEMRGGLTPPEVRVALRKIFSPKFHAIVANPPYILETDEVRKSYHREKIGRETRYKSAYGLYSLAGPFSERAFQLASEDGYVGLIVGNNFMKRSFGKPLIEKVLGAVDLTLVIDTSKAYIPFHSTPTILLFARNRKPVGDTVRSILSRRGETTIPIDPSAGEVWSSVMKGWKSPGFENEFVSVIDLDRKVLQKHPWSLEGGGLLSVKSRIEASGKTTLAKLAKEIGIVSWPGFDDAFVMDQSAAIRLGIPEIYIKPLLVGFDLRDWAATPSLYGIVPYDDDFREIALESLGQGQLHFWKLRTLILSNLGFGGESRLEAGDRPWTWYRWIEARYRVPLSITFAFVATHNHFVLDRGGKAFMRSAPVVKLPAGAKVDEHLELLGFLNSSTGCFWMKQIFQDKGGGTDTGSWQPDPAKFRYEFAATGMREFPIPSLDEVARRDLILVARRLDELADKRSKALLTALPDITDMKQTSAFDLQQEIVAAESLESAILQQQVALQEELDWRVYHHYGLTQDYRPIDPDSLASTNGSPIGTRPFELLQARSGRNIGVDGHALYSEVPLTVSPVIIEAWEERAKIVAGNPALAIIEHESYKRRWFITPKYLAGRVETFRDRLQLRLRRLIGDFVEESAKLKPLCATTDRFVTDLQSDQRFLAIVEVYTGRLDFDLTTLVQQILQSDSVPSNPRHRYSESGILKYNAWLQTWEAQRSQDSGRNIAAPVPPTYVEKDFVSAQFFDLRGKLDVPKERFIAFTEIPNRTDTLYGWAGWTSLQRLKALLAIDEDLEDSGVPLADRAGVLDSAWSLLPWVAQEDPAMANRLKAELQAVVGPEGPSRELIEDWRKRFPPPGTTKKARKGK